MPGDEYDDLIDSLGSPAKKARPSLDYRALYQDVGKKYGVDPDLLYNQAKQESVNFNPHYVYGPGKSPKGAAGLSQFMPDTAKQYGLYVGKGRDDRYNPRLAADAQARMMKDLIAKHGDATLALAAYNSGHNKTSEQARRSAQRIPETRGYVQKIAPKGDKYDQLLDGIGDTPKPQSAAPQSDPYDALLDSLDAPAGKKPSPFARVKAGVGAAQVGDDWRPQSMASQKKLFETPRPSQQPRRSLLGDATTALPGVHQLLRLLPEEERENIAEGVTGALSGTAKQLANTQDLGMQLTGARALGIPNPVTPRIRQLGAAMEQTVAENEASRPAPTTFAGNVRRGIGKGVGAASVELPKLILGGRILGAANLPIQGALARADEGYSGLAKGTLGGLVYHYGGELTGKAFAGLSPYLAKVGNSLVWIAGPVAEQQLVAKATGSEPPNLAQSIGENIPFGIMAGMGARGKVRVKTPRGERDATEADLPKIVSKELEVVPPEREAVPSVPERSETVSAQLDAVRQGTRPTVLITPGTQRPSLPRGMRAEKTSEGVFYYDPAQVSPEIIRQKVADGTFGELLGHVEPKSPATTEAVVARDAEGKEIQSSAVSREKLPAQAELMAEQYPEATVETGDAALAKKVIEERLNARQAEAQRQGVSPEQPGETATETPQRFRHVDFGEIEVLADQSGARPGKIRVAEVSDPTKQHFVKRASMLGRGNERMIPIKESAEVPPEAAPAEKPQQPTETKGVLPATPLSPETLRVEPAAPAQAVEKSLVPEPKVSEQPIKEVSSESTGQRVSESTTSIDEGEGAGGGSSKDVSPAPPKEPSTTSARKAQMAADRAELDLPELPQAERKSWQDTLDRAKVRGTKNASILADEVLAKPRSLNEIETAQLVLRAQEIKNDHSRVMKEIGDEKSPEALQAKRAEVEALEREFDKLTQATKASGTEKGRALASQKLTINQDYDLVSLVQRAKAAKGRDLTLEERTRYEGMAKEIESLTERLGKSEEQLASKQLQRDIDRVVRRGKRAETKKQLDDEFVLLAQQFAQARAQTKGVQPAGLAGLDPEGTLTPLIAKMARNRVRAGVVKAEEVVDHVYEAVSQHIPGITKRDIRDAISGYGLDRKGKPRAEDVKELARIKSELKKLSAQEDIEAGKRLTAAEKARQTNLLKQEADLQRRLADKDFDRPERRPLVYNKETQALVNRVDRLKGEYERELYKAQRGKLGVAWDVGVNVANVPKSLKSMGDVSAVLRQGGYFSLTHPVLSTKAGLDMLRSFSDTGFKNVEREIQAHRDFDLARRSGVEFTGMEKDNPNLSKREEAFLGADIIDRASEIPIAGKVVKPVKAVKDFSERTFVSFLDSQRMQVFSRFADHVRSLKMSPKEETKALKAMAQFVNIGTGRGSLGRRGNQIAPALNTLMFSPRLLASRVQLMNKMVNPVAIARMPKGARSQIIKDNVKFAGTIATALGLAKAAGAGVSLDPDDADFLKIRIGDTRYDILTGLQQPMRFIYRMARALQADVTGSETYAGEKKSALVERFARSKASPVAGGIADYITGEDFKGRKFKLSRQLVDLVTPLYLSDFREAMEEDGIVGALVKTSPALVGVGAQTYKDAPEKPQTHAEKLARKFVRAKMPDNARDEEQIDVDQAKADLKAKSRRGEDVTKELETLGATITDKQARNIINARDKARLQEDVNRLSAKDAIIVWGVMNSGQQQETRNLLEHKATLIDNLPEAQQADVRQRYADAGIEAKSKKKASTGFKKAFNRGFKTQFATQ